MKHLLRVALRSATLLLLLAGSLLPARALAQSDREPGVIVSIADMKQQLDDIGYLLEASGQGHFKAMLNMQVKGLLQGLDNERPMGFAMYFAEESPQPSMLGFIPVSNMDDLIGSAGNLQMDIDEGDDGVFTIGLPNDQSMFVKQSGDYAFLTESKENLEHVPNDPVTLLGNLPKEYNLAVRIFGDNIPEAIRKSMVDKVREGFNQQLENSGSEPDDAQRASMELQLKQIESLVNDAEQVEVGFNINKESQSLMFDCRLVGKPGSKFAKDMAVGKDHQTRFAGFLMKDTAFHGISHGMVSPEDLPALDQFLANVKKGFQDKLGESENMSDEERSSVQKLFDTLIGTIQSTAKNGKVDMGIVGTTNGGNLNVAMAVETADTAALETEIKKVVPMAQRRADDKLSVKLDAFKLLNANFHEFQVAVPEGEEEARKAFGEKLVVNVGFGKDVAFVGLGPGSVDLLKSAMGASASPPADLPMTELNVYLAPILEFAASIQKDGMLTKMAEKLKEVGRDRVTIIGRKIENGVFTRFEIQDGVMQLIPLAQMGGGGPPARDF